MHEHLFTLNISQLVKHLYRLEKLVTILCLIDVRNLIINIISDALLLVKLFHSLDVYTSLEVVVTCLDVHYRSATGLRDLSDVLFRRWV